MKKSLSILLSLLMVISTLFALPASAFAEPEVDFKEEINYSEIYVSDEKAIWDGDYENANFAVYSSDPEAFNVKNNYKGFSYDEATKTLTIKGVTTETGFFLIRFINMGKVNLVVDGTNTLFSIGPESGTELTVKGKNSGKLILNPKVTYINEATEVERIDDFIFGMPIQIMNAKMHIDSSVDVTITNREEHPTVAMESSTELSGPSDCFTYAGNVSPEIKWEYNVSGGPYTYPEYDDTMYVYSEFTPDHLYRLDGDDSETYYVKSGWASYSDYYYYYVPLTRVGDLWFDLSDTKEERAAAYLYNYGTIDEEASFTACTLEDEFPDGLVNSDGKVHAALKRGTDSNDIVYSKNGERYVYCFENWVNSYVEPSVPAASDYPYSMLKIKETGGRSYLELTEAVSVGDYAVNPTDNGDGTYHSLNGQDYTTHWDAYEANNKYFRDNSAKWLKDNGYTQAMVEAFNPYSYSYTCFHTSLTFSGTHTHTPKKAVKENGKAATYDKEGYYYEVVYCKECGKKISSKKVTIPKLKKTDLSKASVSGLKDTAYTGKKITQSITVKLGSKKLKAGTDYSVSYSDNMTVGKATVLITGIKAYKGTIKKTFNIIPAKLSFKPTATKNTITVKWSRPKKNATGYEVQLATDTKFTKNVKKFKASKNNIISTKFSGLKSDKKYHVRLRVYKTVGGTKYYSDWTSKTVTTKK